MNVWVLFMQSYVRVQRFVLIESFRPFQICEKIYREKWFSVCNKRLSRLNKVIKFSVIRPLAMSYLMQNLLKSSVLCARIGKPVISNNLQGNFMLFICNFFIFAANMSSFERWHESPRFHLIKARLYCDVVYNIVFFHVTH